MKGYIINPDRKIVEAVTNGLYKKEGHCPCRVIKDETTLCPCDDSIQNQNCVCKLYVKKEEAGE